MITWITTVGWSPFAVINPIWAYCKDKGRFPSRIKLLHTSHIKILENLDICKKNIFKILKSYSNDRNFQPQIDSCPVKSEDIEIYTEALKDVVNSVIKLGDSELIILDMTPGRKYMSAKVMHVGEQVNSIENPVQVFYLALEDLTYMNSTYPTIPLFTQGLNNILEDADFQMQTPPDPQVQLNDLINQVLNTNSLRMINNPEKQLEIFVLSALALGYDTITRLSRFARENHLNYNRNDINNTVRRLGIMEGYLYESVRISNDTTVDIIIVTPEGIEYLREILEELLTDHPPEALVNVNRQPHTSLDELSLQNIYMQAENKNKKYIDLEVDKLVVFLNELYSHNLRTFHVVDCYYGINLLRVDLELGKDEINLRFENSLRSLPDKKGQKKCLEDLRRNVSNIPGIVFKEIPYKNQFLDAIRKSGVFFNETCMEQFKQKLDQIVNSNPIRGDRYKVFSFDTCTFSNQTFSHLYKYYTSHPIYGNKINRLDFLVSKGVIDELSDFENKYGNKEFHDFLDYLTKIASFPKIVEQFKNQSTLQARLTKLGRCDYLKTKSLANVREIEIGGEESLHMDSRIISGLQTEVQRLNNIDLYLCSHDDNFYGRATGFAGVSPHLFLYKNVLHKKEQNFSIKTSWDTFSRILYYLAVTFGAIILNVDSKDKFVLFGTWPGHKTQDWQRERTRIYSENSILKNMVRDMKIINSD
ncbi:MAG: hypothetical protein JW891_02710 [Candidatus Lokiarchaeota archaeon]|nr:hypothetical protein [Candidatus Lokiarchaeota archaeon]